MNYSNYINYVYKKQLSKDSQKILDEFYLMQKAILPQLTKGSKIKNIEVIRGAANDFFTQHAGPLEKVQSIQNLYLPSVADKYQIPVRLYTPFNSKNDLIVFAHGGGWIQGNLETHEYLCLKMASILKRKVLAVDYRLAPEHTFPCPLDDVFSVYLACLNKKIKNVDNIFVAGDSAGGNLCAALNVKLHKEGLPLTSAQILFYPALSNDLESPSFSMFQDVIALTRNSTLYFIMQYTGGKIYDDDILNNELIFPALADASIFPKTFIVSAGCDVLLDSQIYFSKKLRERERIFQHIIVDGAIHGFMTYGKEFDEHVTHVLTTVDAWLNTTKI